jgi:signal transduction histidine kinase
LNQPLAALLAYAKAAALMAENERTDRAALLDTLGKAQREAARAAEVVARLRDFFRTGATHLENASLPAIATAVVDSLAPRARTFGIQLSQQADPATPPVLIDPLQIEVVLRNLVANGVEAARTASEPKSVLVTIASDGHGFVRASVRDSGPGVPAEAADRIFEPFWTSRSSGMGMGLAISRAIVEAHGGRLWFDGSKGSSFAFTIPTSPHPT